MASKTWVLPLKDFKPTSKNYSVFDKDSCIVCQDYSEIDDFAKAVTLSKLQPLYNADHSADHDPDGSYNAKQFDATKLFRALSIINEPVDKALAGIVKKYFKLEDTKGGTLKDLFSLYAAFPIRTLDELGNDSTIFASEKTKLQGRLRIARSSGDQPMEDSISAEIKKLQETYDDKLKIYNWLYLPGDQRTKLVQAVAPALWSSLTGHKEREKGYKTTRNGGMDDRVLKARLVYTWLAYSISYDNELKDDVDRLQQDRSVADMLISGREVCAGYANLFTEMFNSLLDSDPANAAKKAETVSGLSRQLGGLQYKSDPTEVKFGHAWNVFPTHLSSTSDTDYKVIDPCWAAARDGVHSDPSWWAMSNASFTMSHVPWNVEHCHAALSHADMKTLWNVPQPRLAGEGFPHLEWIDKSTIQPLEPGVTPAGDMREVYVSFRNNCKHQGPKMQGFHLGFKHSVDSMTLFLAREFSEDVSSDFKRFATKSNRSRRSGARNLRFRRILRGMCLSIRLPEAS